MEAEDDFIQAETRYKELSNFKNRMWKWCKDRPWIFPGLKKVILLALSVNRCVITLMIMNILPISLQMMKSMEEG